ncbi:hypothetical protein SLEP1_g49501 [Rubroshorea leprosula]|uniref:Uncharacterized protein n=1 Tax=Rubroshorea leprosula TaxID=152421 RepID=A0AAV5LX05_9ROSI|nr:hypothetical protein SLEP1_g49501 [Rubroshorea leprosula]
MENGSLDDNVGSSSSHESQGFSFTEVYSVQASSSKVICCHFSSDGKLLASGGHDKKAVVFFTDTMEPKSTLEEHSSLITDVRFGPSMPCLATSSFDKTVRVWDADNVSRHFPIVLAFTSFTFSYESTTPPPSHVHTLLPTNSLPTSAIYIKPQYNI